MSIKELTQQELFEISGGKFPCVCIKDTGKPMFICLKWDCSDDDEEENQVMNDIRRKP